jgi:hypothetical protein
MSPNFMLSGPSIGALGPDLRVIAQAAVGRQIVSARITAREAIVYDPYLAGRHVERVTGIVQTLDGDTADWAAIVKRTTDTGLRAARRELAAYRIGIARPDLATGLRSPTLFGWDESDDHVEVWLEALTDAYEGRWPASRYGIAAAHIADWDVAVSAFGSIPGFDSEDAWAERHGQPHRVSQALAELRDHRAASESAELMDMLGDPDFGRTQALIMSTPTRIARLAAFPQTLLHHDLVRSNLFAPTASSTVAIDWENVGRGPRGVDLAPLVVGSVRRGEASADELPEIEEGVLCGYEEGLRQAGMEGVSDVRTAYRLAVGLRWHTVLGTIRSWLDPTSIGMRGSLPGEPRAEALRHLVALSRHILDAGEESTGAVDAQVTPE